ncbi:MAG: hypothetical protein RL329_2994 [Bacteroidota bacterium]
MQSEAFSIYFFKPTSYTLHMYSILLLIHSWLRWAVLIAAAIALFRSFTGWQKKLPFTDADKRMNAIFMGFLHLQLVLGLILYFVSPLTAGFMQNMGTAMKDKNLRFWGLEHQTGIIIGIVVAQIGSIKAKKQGSHKTAFIWFAIAIGLILMSIPFASRPLFNFG